MKNWNNFKLLITGMVIGAVVMGTLMAFAEQIEVAYNNISIYIDGQKIDPKDANGNKVEPFIYNGTTYLPVRAISQALGKEVNWDDSTNSVYIGQYSANNNNTNSYSKYIGYWYQKGDYYKNSDEF